MVVACVRHTDRSSNFIGADGEVRHAYEYMNWDDERRTGQVHVRDHTSDAAGSVV